MLIFLVGFMGSGKSYTARNLAPLLGYDYEDMDKEIEKAEQLTIPEIFAQYGEVYFRLKEKQYIENLNENQNLIVSTGGGAPCYHNNMELMNTKGITIYLNRNKIDNLMRLEKGRLKRPLIANLSNEELAKFYDTKLKEREPYYLKAKIHAFDSDTEDIAQLLQPYLI